MTCDLHDSAVCVEQACRATVVTDVLCLHIAIQDCLVPSVVAVIRGTKSPCTPPVCWGARTAGLEGGAEGTLRLGRAP